MEKFFGVYAALLIPAHMGLAVLRSGGLDSAFCAGLAMHATLVLLYYLLVKANGAGQTNVLLPIQFP